MSEAWNVFEKPGWNPKRVRDLLGPSRPEGDVGKAPHPPFQTKTGLLLPLKKRLFGRLDDAQVARGEGRWCRRL